LRSPRRRCWSRTANVNNNDKVFTKRDQVVALTGPQLDGLGSLSPKLDTVEAPAAYWIHSWPSRHTSELLSMSSGPAAKPLLIDGPRLHGHRQDRATPPRTAPGEQSVAAMRNPSNASDISSRRRPRDNPLLLRRKRLRRVPWARNNLRWLILPESGLGMRIVPIELSRHGHVIFPAINLPFQASAKRNRMQLSIRIRGLRSKQGPRHHHVLERLRTC
jgi:hypothetical protein